MSKYKINLPGSKIPPKVSFQDIMDSFQKTRLRYLNSNNFDQIDFILHEGPPYSNGALHIGHFLNKIIKDAIVRSRLIEGENVSYKLGWDCHGLPIENAVNSFMKCVDLYELRKNCSEFSDKFIDLQKKQAHSSICSIFEKEHYETKTNDYMSTVISVLFDLVKANVIRFYEKLVFYSFEEKSVLSHSEIEYSSMLRKFMYFAINTTSGFSILVWTTQSWTVLGNCFLAVSDKFDYVIAEINYKNYFVSHHFAELNGYSILRKASVSEIVGMKYKLSFSSREGIVILSSDSVEESTGTGILHCAPAHGFDDFNLFLKHHNTTAQNIPAGQISNCVDLEGNMIHPKFSHINIGDKDRDEKICQVLSEENIFAWLEQGEHKHPISWRSSRPIYVVTMKQIGIDLTDEIIDGVIKEIQEVRFIPSEYKSSFICVLEQRRNSIYSLWCLTRQRKWGTPCMLFVHRNSGQILSDQDLNNDLLSILRLEGGDFWFDEDRVCAIFTKFGYDYSHYIHVKDILDVWFDSGCSFMHHKKVYFMGNKEKADLYLEGKDQLRGWFQTSCILQYLFYGKIMIKNIFVHGFVKSSEDEKISKSNKSTQDLSNVIIKSNIDLVRILLLGSNCESDIFISQEGLENSKKTYLKIYNTVRYMINMMSYKHNDFDLSKNLDKLQDFDKYTVYKINNMYNEIRKDIKNFLFHRAQQKILNIVQAISWFIRINRDFLYCSTDTTSCGFQIKIHIFEYLIHKLLFLLYPFIPATVVFLYRQYNEELLTECYVVSEIKKHSQHILDVENVDISFYMSIYDDFYSFYEVFKKEKSINKASCLAVSVLESDQKIDEESLSVLLDTSFPDCSSVSLEDRIQREFLYNGAKIKYEIIDLRKYFKECPRCWEYSVPTQQEKELCKRCQFAEVL